VQENGQVLQALVLTGHKFSYADEIFICLETEF